MIRRSSGATCSSTRETRGGGKDGQAGVGPLHERDRTVEIRLEITPLRGAEPDEAVEIEVGDRRRAPIEMADRERGARHRLLDPERPAGSPDQGRLAGAELAADEDDVAGPEQPGEQAAERLGLGRRQLQSARSPAQKRPSCTVDGRRGIVLDVLLRPPRPADEATPASVGPAEQAREPREVVLQAFSIDGV